MTIRRTNLPLLEQRITLPSILCAHCYCERSSVIHCPPYQCFQWHQAMQAQTAQLVSMLEQHTIHASGLCAHCHGERRLLYDSCTLHKCVIMQQIRQLQKSAESHQQQVAAMHECMTWIVTELQTLSKAADSAATSAQFGTDRKEAVAKMANLLDRMRVLQQVTSALQLCSVHPGAKMPYWQRVVTLPVAWCFTLTCMQHLVIPPRNQLYLITVRVECWSQSC